MTKSFISKQAGNHVPGYVSLRETKWSKDHKTIPESGERNWKNEFPIE